MAFRSCKRETQFLRDFHGKLGEEFEKIIVSYDGEYQKWTTKGGGAFPSLERLKAIPRNPRYCF